MNSNDTKKLIKMYESAPINQSYEPKLTIEPHQSSIVIDVKPIHFHAANYLHGSVIFKLLDDAAFFAAQAQEPDYFIVTASFTVYFVRPVNSGQLTATGTVITTTKNQFIAESRVMNEQGKWVAKGSGVFQRSNVDLSSTL